MTMIDIHKAERYETKIAINNGLTMYELLCMIKIKIKIQTRDTTKQKN